MKTYDLKLPFRWDDPTILIHDRVWYLPERIHPKKTFIFPGWQHSDLFGNNNPIMVEYCSGNGAWIAAKAAENPQINWVAVEKKFVRVKKIWFKVKTMNLNNLIVIWGEGHHVTKSYFVDQFFKGVYINFPDPWPKNRHAKHRLVQTEFIHEVERILTEKSFFNLVTDDPHYSEGLIEIMAKQKDFKSIYPSPFYSIDQKSYGAASYFEQLWRSKGREIRYHQFQKIKA